MLESYRELVSLLRRKLELLLLLRARGEALLECLVAARGDPDPDSPRSRAELALESLAEQDVLVRQLRSLDREVSDRCKALAAAVRCPGEATLGELATRLPGELRDELMELRRELLRQIRELEKVRLTLRVVADQGRRFTARLLDAVTGISRRDGELDASMINVMV